MGTCINNLKLSYYY